jgi:hypothetical protein
VALNRCSSSADKGCATAGRHCNSADGTIRILSGAITEAHKPQPEHDPLPTTFSIINLFCMF